MPNVDDRVDFLAEEINLSNIRKIVKKYWSVLAVIVAVIGASIWFRNSSHVHGIAGLLEWLQTSAPGVTIVAAALTATHGFDFVIFTPLTWLIKKYLKWAEKRRPKPIVPGLSDSLSNDESEKIFPAWRKALYWIAQSAWIYGYYGVYLGIRANGFPPGGSESPLFSELAASWIGQAWVYPVIATIPMFYVERFLTLSPRYEEARKQAAKAYAGQYQWRPWIALAWVIAITELAALMA